MNQKTATSAQTCFVVERADHALRYPDSRFCVTRVYQTAAHGETAVGSPSSVNGREESKDAPLKGEKCKARQQA